MSIFFGQWGFFHFHIWYCNSDINLLKIPDDKFDWSHHAMDTAKAVEALSQRDISSPQRHHDFNNHMVTMSSLHQAQKPLSDYIRNANHSTGAVTNRPQTGKRSVKSPIKSHPSPFDEQNKVDAKKGRDCCCFIDNFFFYFASCTFPEKYYSSLLKKFWFVSNSNILQIFGEKVLART